MASVTPENRARSTRPTRVAAAVRRVQLLEVAADIVSSGGVRALTVEAVAEKAGVHRPIVYRHFENAEQLLAAVIERELGLLGRSTKSVVDGVEGFEPRLRAAMTSWMHQFASSAMLMNAALVRAPTTDELRARRRAQNNASMSWLTAELNSAGLTATDSEIAAALLLTGLTGVVSLWRAKRITRDIATDRFVAMATSIVTGLRPGA
jgi:AcrR family transcriptional regulator